MAQAKQNQANQDNQERGSVIKPLLIVIITTVVLAIFIILAILLMPRDAIPVFEITDRKGSWEAQGTIAVFDDKIKPGSEGEYSFVITSDSEGVLRYGLQFTEYLYTEALASPFMQYRLKMDGVYIDSDDTAWHYINDLDYYGILILPETEHIFTLEWRWPFEIGRDENDTLVGRAGGTVSLVFFVWAEVVE